MPAVITLTRSLGAERLAPILKGIVKPLIIAILAALPFGLLGIELPQLVITTGNNYFANMTPPLALLCTGASLNLKDLRGGATLTGWAMVNFRLCCIPCCWCWGLGARLQPAGPRHPVSHQLSPTAAAS